MSRVAKKPDFVTISIYAVLAVFVIYFAASLGACFDLSSDEEGKVDFDNLANSLETTLMDTELVFEQVKAGGNALMFPLFTAFGIGLYVLMKVTGKKRFHRKGEEHGSSRWANKKEIALLLDKPPKPKNGEKKPRDQPKPKKGEFVMDNNIILTNDVKMSLNTRQTRKNLNVMVIGGSGSGKSRFYVKPNLMQANTSYVCTDPKGELLRSTGKMLKSYGYKIKVFNLIDMAHSHNYNPFNYIYDVDGNYSATAVIKMVNVLMKNTSKEGGGGGDQFWDDSTKALLAALCFYLVECEDKSMQNFSEVMKLLKKAEVKEGSDDYQSDLDLIFDALEFPEKYQTEEAEHNEQFKSLNLIDLAKSAKPASQYMCLKYYKDFKKAAGDTAKSILISTAVRLQAFNIPEVMDLTCCDNIHLEMIGDEKTVMYIIIPSSDDTFNFLAAMMYTQLFDVLYDRANFKHGGRLPFHVRCLLDEFANVGTIPRFEELLATMRSMEISANVIIQNLSQLKKMYKDSWENVLGNCDSLLFLGGQEPTTLEHVSKTLGKETIDTRFHNRTRGRNGSTSENDGSFSFEKVPYGTWVIREIESPTGFVLSEEEIAVTVGKVDEVVEIELVNYFIKGNIELTKVDADYPDNKLTGAVFEVYADTNGNGEFDKDDELCGEMTELEGGVYQMTELRYGKYFVREKTAPDGFVLDEGVYGVSIEENGKTYTVENKAGVGFINDAQKGSLKIVKTSSDGKVEGFSFRVTSADGYDQTFKTDKNGEIFIEGLRIGEYTVSEVSDSASAGYILPADKQATVKTDSITIVEMHNEFRDTPKTGDDFNLGLWVSLAAASVIGAGVLGFVGFKKKKKED